MIKNLYIKNFVLIEETALDFHHGFSAFTGETGAGKSILIDAISLLCADRAGSSYVMKGKDKAIIEGTFDLSQDQHALDTLQNAGFDVDEETTFTREISASGKSVVRIDHRIANLSLLKECLRYEIDIHGQRDNAYLLNTAEHVHLLDAFIGCRKELDETAAAFDAWRSLTEERDHVLQDTYNENDLEYFRYQIEEIEDADLKPGEDEELAAREKQYRSVKESFDRLSQIFSLYDDSVSDGLYELNHLIQSLKMDERTEKIQDTVNDAYYAVSDAMDQLHVLIDEMDLSEDDINEMEERLFLIQKLKRKYGRTIEDILEEKEKLQSRVEAMTHRQEYLDRMNREIDKAQKKYEEKASVLSAVRRQNAHRLDEQIADNLKQLMLENARFHTEIGVGKASRSGNDRVEFLISMNKGEDLKSLSKTASGGELSRLMLGLKEIFTHLQGIQTVIFDEIDTGVSGPVATAIGRKMHDLASECQVFSVTHLAQVAACADYHYLVKKDSDDRFTRTSVKELQNDERIDQLALIASGEITPASKKAARELFRRNHS